MSYELDLKRLEESYLHLQKLTHPDVFVNKPTREKLYANQYASFSNQAYETLKDPLQRGYYLLALLGHDNGDQEGETFTDPDFLMMAMMEQESLELSCEPEQIQRRIETGQQNLLTYEESIKQAFQEEDFDTVLASLRRYKYQQKFIDAATQRLKQLRH